MKVKLNCKEIKTHIAMKPSQIAMTLVVQTWSQHFPSSFYIIIQDKMERMLQKNSGSEVELAREHS